jgi:osmoprotectant transport system substrate-binding protein
MSAHLGRTTLLKAAALAISVPLAIGACSDSSGNDNAAGSSPSAGGSAAASGTNCSAKSGSDLVVLKDDKQSQASDNIVPVVNSKVNKAPLTGALNSVSKALTQDKLVALNKEVSVNRTPEATAAKNFVSDNNLGQGLSGGSGSIIVAAANFSENVALANVYAEVLKKAGYSATVKEIGSRQLLEPALERNEVQVTPEYAASLTTFLAKKVNSSETPSGDIDKTLSTLRPLAEKQGLAVLDAAPANDQNAFAVTKATADAYGLTSLSDLATKCSNAITFGAPPECPQNNFCQPALEKTYNLQIKFTALDADGPLTRQALKQGRVLLGEVFSSDADVTAASS